MKGIVFTEFMDLVERKFGLQMVDRIIEQSDLPSKGIYTSIGTYDFSEMLCLLKNLSDNTDIDIDELLLIYGEHFFDVLATSYGNLLNQYDSPVTLLGSIENHIHVEVQKIYPEAELPTFEVLHKTDTELTMVYKSSRAMYSFGLGLMKKTFAHFNKQAQIDFEKIKENGTEVKFMIKMIDEQSGS